ncbi:MAG: hypothetical protein SPJ04_03185 [Bdellovibrionota bacterium]|nr:hypothetical protein [Pseudomonadota bacterium]MDY6090241.1 hypothetical protein [Bdellovibrionota bacterium]
MQIDKISYINPTPNDQKSKKSFYRNDESEDAITFSSELNKDGDNNPNLYNKSKKEEKKLAIDIEVLANNVQDTDSTISTSESVIKSNSVKAFSKGKDKNNTEKLNIII